jgi:hypothetical protein
MLKLLTVLTLGAACVFAQKLPLSAPLGGPETAASSPRNYQGCVIRSGGKILLTDARGTEYYLVSSGRKLDSYVGQEVQLTALSVNPADPSSSPRNVENGEAQGQPTTLSVETIAKTADHCASPK